MSDKIISFRAHTQKTITPEQKLEAQAHLARVTQAFARRVDYNIRWVSGVGYDYISRVLYAIFRSIIASQWRYSDVDTYLRVEHQIQDCTVFDCASLIQLVDEYLQKVHVQESPEKAFFMHVRNIAFQRKNELVKQNREK